MQYLIDCGLGVGFRGEVSLIHRFFADHGAGITTLHEIEQDRLTEGEARIIANRHEFPEKPIIKAGDLADEANTRPDPRDSKEHVTGAAREVLDAATALFNASQGEGSSDFDRGYRAALVELTQALIGEGTADALVHYFEARMDLREATGLDI